jgi:high-affinity nickel permease
MSLNPPSVPSDRRRIGFILGSLTLLNVAALVVLSVVSFFHPAQVTVNHDDMRVDSLFGVGMIAYVLGLRHACDAGQSSLTKSPISLPLKTILLP